MISSVSSIAAWSRRQFLGTVAGAVGFAGLARFASALPAITAFPFEEVPVSASGIIWVHKAGKSAEKYLPETSGAGCAFLDYDNDGWMDIYLVNSGKCDFYDTSPPLHNALYHNNRDGTFTDVTEKAGVTGGGYGQGVAVGDYDGDGFPDIYVTQYGRSILYHNNGAGTFTDVQRRPESRRRGGHRAQCGSITTTMDGSICLSAASLTSAKRRTFHALLTTSRDTVFLAFTSRWPAGQYGVRLDAKEALSLTVLTLDIQDGTSSASSAYSFRLADGSGRFVLAF